MSRAPPKFREAEIARILRAATKAGMPVRVEITPAGAIIISTLDAPASADGDNPWNEVFTHGEGRPAVRSKI
jgi:hypothetical protein